MGRGPVAHLHPTSIVEAQLISGYTRGVQGSLNHDAALFILADCVELNGRST